MYCDRYINTPQLPQMLILPEVHFHYSTLKIILSLRFLNHCWLKINCYKPVSYTHLVVQFLYHFRILAVHCGNCLYVFEIFFRIIIFIPGINITIATVIVPMSTVWLGIIKMTPFTFAVTFDFQNIALIENYMFLLARCV